MRSTSSFWASTGTWQEGPHSRNALCRSCNAGYRLRRTMPGLRPGSCRLVSIRQHVFLDMRGMAYPCLDRSKLQEFSRE